MSNDYTLPLLPGPAIAKKYGPQVEAYGHACAEAARAPLLARIAELEEMEREFTNTIRTQYGHFFKCQNERDRLRAEVEALKSALAAERAASVIEWEPGRSYTAAELLRRAIRGIRGRKSWSICPAVENLFGCGNTVARYLCRWAGRDPDTGQEIAARKGEGSEG